MMCDYVKRTEKVYMEAEGITDLEVERLIIIIGGSAGNFSNSFDMEIEGDSEYGGQLSGTEDFARN
jgi:hypothetical protein